MLHLARHTHILHLLNACHEYEKISAASARLPATILTMGSTRFRYTLFRFRGFCLKTLVAQIARPRDSISNGNDVTGRFAFMAVLAKHIVLSWNV
jgi:hypothetical protein